MKFLVIGGTGMVGGEVVRGLLGRGERVRVLTRSAAKARSLPEGAEGAVGDLADPPSLRRPLEGVDGVFLATPVNPEETKHGLAAVEAVGAAGAGRLVYMSVHRADEGAHIPHFGSKLPIEAAVRGLGVPFTILRPNNFFQNDLQIREAIGAYGVYPQPMGSVGLSRVDVRDIAHAAVNALTGPGHEGQTYPLVGPDVLTGEATAAVYSRHLGREIRYGGDDLDAWAEQVRAGPAGLAGPRPPYDVRTLPTPGAGGDGRRPGGGAPGPGREPRRFEDFAAELADQIKRDQPGLSQRRHDMGPETLDEKVALVTGFQVLGGVSIILTTATSGRATRSIAGPDPVSEGLGRADGRWSRSPLREQPWRRSKIHSGHLGCQHLQGPVRRDSPTAWNGWLPGLSDTFQGNCSDR